MKSRRPNSPPLRKNAPFPSKANLDQVEEQKKDAAKIITAFQVDLAKNQFPLETEFPRPDSRIN